MNDDFLIPLALIYLAVVGLLFIFGINFFYLTVLSFRNKKTREIEPPVDWPYVTIQLPIFNERYVARRLIEAAAQLDYPGDRLQIQVLDDSTDNTASIAGETVRALAARGIDIVHLHRESRTGFKAGALAEGAATAKGEFLAIFDADFVPGADFLKQTVPAFEDPKVAFVQTRWGHLNRNYNLLTLLQSIAIDAHFMVEQYARFNGGYWFNFNGTAGIWRKAAIEDAGGWLARTLTEDLDLSYRAFLKGWRAVYLRDVEVRAELPVTISAYRRQQRRWAQGSLECALILLPEVWSRPESTRKKIEAGLHMTGYAVHLLLFVLALLYPGIVLLSTRFPGLISLFGIAAVFNLTAFAPTIFFIAAQRQLGENWWKKIPSILFITALGTGMMLNTVRAALNIITKRSVKFERTPKFGIAGKRDRWQQRDYQIRIDPIVYFEFAFAAYNIYTLIAALQHGNWVIAIYACLFSVGLLFAASLSVLQNLSLRISLRNQQMRQNAA